MNNEQFYNEVASIIEKAEKGAYTFEVSQYNKSGHCIFNAYVDGIEERGVWALLDHVVNYHPLAEVEVMKDNEVLFFKKEYESIDYWKEA